MPLLNRSIVLTDFSVKISGDISGHTTSILPKQKEKKAI